MWRVFSNFALISLTLSALWLIVVEYDEDRRRLAAQHELKRSLKP